MFLYMLYIYTYVFIVSTELLYCVYTYTGRAQAYPWAHPYDETKEVYTYNSYRIRMSL